MDLDCFSKGVVILGDGIVFSLGNVEKVDSWGLFVNSLFNSWKNKFFRFEREFR